MFKELVINIIDVNKKMKMILLFDICSTTYEFLF